MVPFARSIRHRWTLVYFSSSSASTCCLVRMSSTTPYSLACSGRHVEIAVGVLGDPLDRLAGVVGQDLVEHFAGLEDLVGLDFDVRDLPADLAVGLVDHHLGVRQGEALALGAAGQEHRPAAGGQADAIGGHGATENLHRVVDGQRGADAAARRIDVEVDVLAAVFALQVEQLHHQFVGVAVVDLALQQDDAVLQQQIAEGHLPLPLVVAIGQQRIDNVPAAEIRSW